MNKTYIKTLSISFIITVLLSACANAPEPTPTPAAPPEIVTTTPDIIEEPVDPYPPCECEPPVGMLAPHSSSQPAQQSIKTPRDTLVVGTERMRGEFVTGWGNNPPDDYIKTLTGGYRDTYWTTPGGQILLNESAVCNVKAEYDKDWNKTYIFTLHSYNKWSNGEPITARDYVAGILAYASPAFTASGGASNIGEGIIGFEAYARDNDGGEEPSLYFKGIQLINDFTFSATISREKLPYFWETGYVTFTPVCMAGWFPGNELISDENGTRFKNPIDEDIEAITNGERDVLEVACGPYKLVSFGGSAAEDGTAVDGSATGSEAVLERNEHFGVCPEGYVPYFDYIIQKEVSGREGIEMLREGEIDLLQGISLDDINILYSAKSGDDSSVEQDLTDEADNESEESSSLFIEIKTYPRAGYGFLEFALDYGPTQDCNVRLAIAEMLDRSIIIEQALGGRGETVDGVYSPAQWVYMERHEQITNELTMFVFNPAKANSLLDETQWIFEADCSTRFDPELAAPDGSYLRHNAGGEPLQIKAASASESIGGALASAAAAGAPLIGMEFAVEIIDAPTLLDHYYNAKTWEDNDKSYHALQLAMDFTPVHDMYWHYHSSLAETYLNSNGVQDDELDRLAMAMRSLDPSQKDEYADLWAEFQMRLQQMLPALPLYVNYYYDAYNNIVTQVPTTAFAPYSSVITHMAKH